MCKEINITSDNWQVGEFNLGKYEIKISDDLIDQISDRVMEKMKVAHKEQLNNNINVYFNGFKWDKSCCNFEVLERKIRDSLDKATRLINN